mmetsp:Transcript_39502/g.84295  ORF Transcript_39502/g.84295 Transcript_39502/m.84295 type:complete len:266 (+) Transcript_39502:131-928(+)
MSIQQDLLILRTQSSRSQHGRKLVDLAADAGGVTRLIRIGQGTHRRGVVADGRKPVEGRCETPVGVSETEVGHAEKSVRHADDCIHRQQFRLGRYHAGFGEHARRGVIGGEEAELIRRIEHHLADLVAHILEEPVTKLDVGPSFEGKASHHVNDLQERLANVPARGVLVDRGGRGLGIEGYGGRDGLEVAVLTITKRHSSARERSADERLRHPLDVAGRRVGYSVKLNELLRDERRGTRVLEQVHQEGIDFVLGISQLYLRKIHE